MATHSSILAWKIARTEEPGRLQSMESQSDTTLRLNHNSPLRCNAGAVWFYRLALPPGPANSTPQMWNANLHCLIVTHGNRRVQFLLSPAGNLLLKVEN